MIREEAAVLQVVREIGDPLLDDIEERVPDCRETVRALVKDGLLRMKEDPVDHDWAYVLTAAGEAALKLIEEGPEAKA